MEKSKRNLILFMPSIDGGGVEKNLFIMQVKIDSLLMIKN